jgi:uncharacterized protein YprB with RNaseH-like and TPR domain
MATNLVDRLRQIATASTGARASADEEAVAFRPEARDASESHGGFSRGGHHGFSRRGHGQLVADVLGGQWVESDEGAVLVVDRFYAADRRHGRWPIGAIVETLDGAEEPLQVLARAWPGREPRPYTSNLCFLDVETTGLAGGAGTTAFLIGVALIEDGGLRVRQLLLPGFEHERALLKCLARWLTEPRNRATPEPPTLVTFNGRSFDVPLIETRYLFHRLTVPFEGLPHLDMLHPARRLWKQRPMIAGPALDDDSCRLSVLERHLAGYHRIGDVPGFEIPSRYFRFVRADDVPPLEAVLEHNRIDLLSLALVAAKAIVLITQGPGATTHPREALGLGRVYERSGMNDNAEASYAHAAALAARVDREPDVRAEALRRLARCRRRAGRMSDAAGAWLELVSLPGCPAHLRREAREALAIHHEHRSRDLETAHSYVLDVLAEHLGRQSRTAAEYRLARIQRKLARRIAEMNVALLPFG